MKKKRVFIIVLDSFGIGAQEDAELFGDSGANTLLSLKRSGKLNIPTLTELGMGCIDGVEYIPGASAPLAAHGRMRELSRGKDTTIGHWELMGIVSEKPLPTFPCGFPEELLSTFSERVGRGILCNKPYSGTEVIADYGETHLKSGDLIVYTSADSVFQIAAHEDKIPLDELYDICRTAREILTGEYSVGRVIARPFVGTPGNFTRTGNRRDFSLPPPEETTLDKLKKKGFSVISVGKIADIFASCGITESALSHSNREGMEITEAYLERDFNGICFTNLVDFDSKYGHRQDAEGYALAISEFDLWLSGFIKKLRRDDALIITADHGCDPADDSTDHTREFVPLFVLGDGIAPKSLGTKNGFSAVSDIVTTLLDA